MNIVLAVEQVLGTGGGWQGPPVWFVIVCVCASVCHWVCQEYQCACGASAHQATELTIFSVFFRFAPSRSNRSHTGAEAHQGHSGTRSQLRD